MLKTELKPEIFGEVVDSIMQTEEWFKIATNDPRINAAENEVFSLLESVQKRIPEDVYNQLMDAIAELGVSYTETATLYGMSVANTLRELAANPNVYSRYITDRMAKRGSAA